MKLVEALPQEQTLMLGDGKTYTFSEFHLNAQAAVEDKYGFSLLGTDSDGSVGFSTFLSKYLTQTRTWRFLAHQLLKKHHKELTEDEVGYLITPDNQIKVFQILMRQFVNSFPVPDEQKKIALDELNNLLGTIGA